eukprot:sb/3474772/
MIKTPSKAKRYLAPDQTKLKIPSKAKRYLVLNQAKLKTLLKGYCYLVPESRPNSRVSQRQNVTLFQTLFDFSELMDNIQQQRLVHGFLRCGLPPSYALSDPSLDENIRCDVLDIFITNATAFEPNGTKELMVP